MLLFHRQVRQTFPNISRSLIMFLLPARRKKKMLNFPSGKHSIGVSTKWRRSRQADKIVYVHNPPLQSPLHHGAPPWSRRATVAFPDEGTWSSGSSSCWASRLDGTHEAAPLAFLPSVSRWSEVWSTTMTRRSACFDLAEFLITVNQRINASLLLDQSRSELKEALSERRRL